MTKFKPKKAIKSRFKVTGTGKLLRAKPGKRHILTKKSSKRKRHLSKQVVLGGKLGDTYAHLIGV